MWKPTKVLEWLWPMHSQIQQWPLLFRPIRKMKIMSWSQKSIWLSKKNLQMYLFAPVCEDNIEDSSQDSIFCECTCNTWIHRKWAGLTKAAFQKVTESPMPFFCLQCQLLAHEKLIISMKASINLLVDQVSALSPQVPITGNSSQVLLDTIISYSCY